jgi:hypothetical protein
VQICARNISDVTLQVFSAALRNAVQGLVGVRFFILRANCT